MRNHFLFVPFMANILIGLRDDTGKCRKAVYKPPILSTNSRRALSKGILRMTPQTNQFHGIAE
jgi:hypothetical protein